MKKIIILCIALCITTQIWAQEKRRNRVTYGFGVGNSEGTTMKGLGQVYTLGYERALWKERLRFTYQLSYGLYNSKATIGIAKMWFNGYNIVPGFDLTLFTIKSVSLCIAGGGVINKSQGLVGSDDDIGTNDEAYYFDETHYGFMYNVGIRYGDPKGRLFYKLEWDNLKGTKNYSGMEAKFVFGIKL